MITRDEGHLIVAAVRVVAHREDRPPRPEEVAALIGMPPEALRLKMVALADAGILTIVESAFDTHLEIRDHTLIDQLAMPEDRKGMDEEIAAFEQHKQQEAERMSRLFDEGDHEKRQAERLKKMDEDLRDFKKRKPKNPFGED